MPGASPNERFAVLGVGIHAVTTATSIERVRSLVRDGTNGYVVFCTVSSVLTAYDDPVVHRALEDASLVTPDGMPLVWLGKRSSSIAVERVYGPDFMVDLMSATGGEFSHYFFGGHGGVGADLIRNLKGWFPDLRVAGYHEPAHGLGIAATPDDLALINGSGADLLWVGLGHPKQELWMHDNLDLLDVPVALGVGAAFDFHAGRKKEAPAWMKRAGLQWLHRLIKEPRRLWRRYLVGNPRFVALLIKERITKR